MNNTHHQSFCLSNLSAIIFQEMILNEGENSHMYIMCQLVREKTQWSVIKKKQQQQNIM